MWTFGTDQTCIILGGLLKPEVGALCRVDTIHCSDDEVTNLSAEASL